jgi:threonine/homoserine/homoserine lactone efflux protein
VHPADVGRWAAGGLPVRDGRGQRGHVLRRGGGLRFDCGTRIVDRAVGLVTTCRGGFLLYLGIKTFFSKPSEVAVESRRGGSFGAYLTTFFLTITNPLTILSFIAIFAGLRLGETDGNYLSATLMVLGVFLGSASWWLTLSTGVSLLREKFTPALLTWVNRLAGGIIFAFGLLALFLKN